MSYYMLLSTLSATFYLNLVKILGGKCYQLEIEVMLDL